MLIMSRMMLLDILQDSCLALQEDMDLQLINGIRKVALPMTVLFQDTGMEVVATGATFDITLQELDKFDLKPSGLSVSFGLLGESNSYSYGGIKIFYSEDDYDEVKTEEIENGSSTKYTIVSVELDFRQEPVQKIQFYIERI